MEQAPQNPEQDRRLEKEQVWNQKREEIESIRDQLGRGIDEKIKEAVVVLKVFDFPTSQSCEGHFEEEEGAHSFPWVEICLPEPEGLDDDEEKKKEFTLENLKEQKKLMDYLAEFYERRETPFDARLTFDRIGGFGGFRVQSFGGRMMELLTPEEKEKKIALYRQEMDDFAKFLKERFLSGK